MRFSQWLWILVLIAPMELGFAKLYDIEPINPKTGEFKINLIGKDVSIFVGGTVKKPRVRLSLAGESFIGQISYYTQSIDFNSLRKPTINGLYVSFSFEDRTRMEALLKQLGLVHDGKGPLWENPSGERFSLTAPYYSPNLGCNLGVYFPELLPFRDQMDTPAKPATSTTPGSSFEDL